MLTVNFHQCGVKILIRACKNIFKRKSPLVVLRTLSQRVEHSLVEPNQWIFAECIDAQTNSVVGKVGYGQSPLGDSVLLDGIEVNPGVRRRGYGTSIVKAVSNASLHGKTLPVTPVHIIAPSLEFWQNLQSGSVKGLVVNEDIQF